MLFCLHCLILLGEQNLGRVRSVQEEACTC